MKREPVMIGGLVVAVVEMFILMCVQMGWLSWDSQQIASFNNFVVAFIVLAAVAIPIVGAYIARSRVTPIADPKLPDDVIQELIARS